MMDAVERLGRFMYKVAVVGPKQSVNRILEIAKELEQDLTFIPYIYEKTSEVKEFVLQSKTAVDYWLFSGYIPYQIAVNATGEKETYVHIDSSELSIYKGIVQLSKEHRRMLERISVDAIEGFFFEDELLQVERMLDQTYIKKFDVEINDELLFDFHNELWKKEEIEAAFTCYPTVYEKLKEAGIPAFWLSPSRNEVSHTIRMFFEKIKTSYYKDTQISTAMIEFLAYDTIQEKLKESYQLEYLKLHLKKTLLQLCECLDGSLFEEGNGRYAIFSTRGAIESEIKLFKEKIEHLKVEADSEIAVGIGYGQTVFAAEMNANRAIRESKEKEAKEIVMIEENGMMVDIIGEETLVYTYRTDDPDIVAKLEEGNISIKTFNRITSLVRKMSWADFTTKDLAIHLKMSDRNAQRIVADLCKVQLVEHIGKSSPHSKGRPVNVYKLSEE